MFTTDPEAHPDPEHALVITEYALNKAQAYARLMPDREVFGFLIGALGSNEVSDVCVAPRQSATGASVDVDARAVLDVGVMVQRSGRRTLGMWHSHAQMQPFHSSTDDQTVEDVLLPQLAPATARRAFHTFSAKSGPSSVELWSGQEQLELELASEHPDPAGVQLRRFFYEGFAYSLVVNARGDTPHAEKWLKRWCPCCNAPKVERHVVRLQLSCVFDESLLAAEVLAAFERGGAGSALGRAFEAFSWFAPKRLVAKVG
jgi:hypothetical protein